MNSHFREEKTGSEKLSHAPLACSQQKMGVVEESAASLEAPGHGW